MYKELIQRKIGFLVNKKNDAIRKSSISHFSFFSDKKREEILVWMWLNEDKDKDQIKELICDRFNISKEDAERLFYEAFPDGVSLDENNSLTELDSIMSELIGVEPNIISDTICILKKEAPETALEQYNIPKNVQNQIKLVLSTLLQKRKLI